MHWNDRGELNPIERRVQDPCGEACHQCYSVCPAHGETPDETELARACYAHIEGIEYRPETGFVLGCYVGYAHKGDLRRNGASGGVATWTLEALMESGAVDTVAAVGAREGPAQLFEYRLCKTSDQVRSCSRSAYYPVEIGGVIRHIIENEGRYAIIALPCVCKAVRLAQRTCTKLKQRIVHVAGLACGRSCSKHFAEYICAIGGGNPKDIRSVAFRVKDSRHPNNRCMQYHTREGTRDRSGAVRGPDGLDLAWAAGYFQPRACFYCDDVYAECADISFMDAWLPEYEGDAQGHSIVLVRSLELKQMLDEGKLADLMIEPLPVEKAISSQAAAIARKRSWQRHRGGTPPKRRQALMRRARLHVRLLKRLAWECASASPGRWIECDRDAHRFARSMRRLRFTIELIHRTRAWVRTARARIRRMISMR